MNIINIIIHHTMSVYEYDHGALNFKGLKSQIAFLLPTLLNRVYCFFTFIIIYKSLFQELNT